jgi:uncharacterized membrane protein
MSKLSFVRGYLPYVVFAALASVAWQWGALAALALGLVSLVRQRTSGVPESALVLDIATVVYFALLTTLAFAAPHSPLHHYTGALSFGWLALIAGGSLAVRRPFTLGIAKLGAPRELWDNPGFVRVNVVITTVWATCFTVAAVISLILAINNVGVLVTTLIQVIAFVLPAAFTIRYPKIIQARLAAANGS